jgi:RNA-binding protein
MKRHIRHELSTGGPTVWIGKEGSTPQIVKEISRQLDQREMVKAKLLQTALKDMSAKEVATRIAKETESILVEVRGHTFILYRRKRKKA